MRDAYDIFMSKVEKYFQDAVDEVAIEDCINDYVLHMIAYGFLLDSTGLAETKYHHKPLTVRLASDENPWLMKIDLEMEWTNALSDYGDDKEMGEMVRNNGKQLVSELRRVARELELLIIEQEAGDD